MIDVESTEIGDGEGNVENWSSEWSPNVDQLSST
jgi:hypothetical protein